MRSLRLSQVGFFSFRHVDGWAVNSHLLLVDYCRWLCFINRTDPGQGAYGAAQWLTSWPIERPTFKTSISDRVLALSAYAHIHDVGAYDHAARASTTLAETIAESTSNNTGRWDRETMVNQLLQRFNEQLHLMLLAEHEASQLDPDLYALLYGSREQRAVLCDAAIEHSMAHLTTYLTQKRTIQWIQP